MKAIFIDLVFDEASAAEQREALQALPSARSILRALYLGISERLPITREQFNLFHADDLMIGTAMLNTLETIATGMVNPPQRFPDAEAEART